MSFTPNDYYIIHPKIIWTQRTNRELTSKSAIAATSNVTSREIGCPGVGFKEKSGQDQIGDENAMRVEIGGSRYSQ
jgi:hypothetical protein